MKYINLENKKERDLSQNLSLGVESICDPYIVIIVIQKKSPLGKGLVNCGAIVISTL